MKQIRKRLSLFLTVCMIISMMLTNVYALDVSEINTAENTSAVVKEMSETQTDAEATEASEMTLPQTTVSEMPAALEVTEPEMVIGTTAAETAILETTAAETTAPETTVSETTVAETAVSETTVAETTISETTVAETTVSETTVSETTVSETTVPGENVPVSAEESNLVVLDEMYLNPISTFALKSNEFYKIVHLDAGRKYFSADSIKTLIDTISEAGFDYLELAIGNDGLRFLLNDMTLTVDGTTYSSEEVRNAIHTGNEAYHDFEVDELTEEEMNTILDYAEIKGISIIPLINTPGHMDAILDAGEALTGQSLSYSGSGRTIDVTNASAVKFTQALLQLYIDYFANKGCTMFNMGADEYANDIYTGGGMGFGQLLSQNQYSYFVQYVNQVAGMIKTADMVPMAFNDGIYYNNTTNAGTFDTDIAIAYWSSGWSGYNVASAETLAGKGFSMINTHGDYYWVLGKTDAQCSAERAQGFSYTSFPGSTVESADGAMFCIWCDYPGAGTEENVLSSTQDVIAAFGATLPTTEKVESENTVFSEDKLKSVKAPGLTSVTVTSAEAPTIANAEAVVAYSVTPYVGETAYESRGIVTLPIPEGWDSARVGAFVVETDGTVTLINNGTVENGNYVFRVEHFSTMGLYEEAVQVKEETITLNVNGTTTRYADGMDYSNSIDISELNTIIAAVSANYEDEPGSVTYQKVNSITSGNTYLIGDGNGNYLTLDINGELSNSTDTSTATKWTITESDTICQISSGAIYLSVSWSTSGSKLIASKSASNWSYVEEKGFYDNFGRRYLNFDQDTWNVSWKATNYGAPYAESGTQSKKGTTITFTAGNVLGTTYVTVGDTRYTIHVVDNAPEGSLTSKELTIEYWITNSPVFVEQSDSAASSIIINSDADESYTSSDGIDVSTVVSETGYGNFDNWVEVKYWQTMKLDLENHQTGDNGDDETADGIAFTHIRYHGGAWQYKTTNGVWTYFEENDQVVTYYMRHTEITQEVVTAMKDWGYVTNSTTPSNNTGQVALTIAVVYPDGTVSPSENQMYAKSTTIFNYWENRNIGLIAPISNSDYDISKITVTDGQRTSNSGGNSWHSTDTITWEKITNAAGTQWYDEIEVWNDTMETAPMANGINGYPDGSNIVWSGRDTAKLVLIYLKPVHHDTNLTVNWVDDSADGALIHTQEIVVSYEGGEENKVTFLHSEKGLQQKSKVQVGNITLDEDAYIINSSGVNQTFNKDITMIQGVAGQYTSGLYQYISADISEDGMILTLHYILNAKALAKQYVIDFGLPVKISLSELVDNTDNVVNVVVSENATYDSSSRSITYTPENVLNNIEAVTVRVEYGTTSTTFNIGFVPATTVYYEEMFAVKGTSKTKLPVQTMELVGNQTNLYGYDPVYATDSVGASNGTQINSIAAGTIAEFEFTGTGIVLYANCDTGTGTVMVKLYKEGALKQVTSVDTKMANGEFNETADQNVTAYNVPIVSIHDLDHGIYTVKISHVKSGSAGVLPVHLDGFRVYDTLDDTANDAYEKDGEASPVFMELRDALLNGYQVSTVNSEGSIYVGSKDDKKYYMQQVYNESVAKNTIAYAGVEEINVADLLNNGPKNEIYLPSGAGITFTINGTFSEVHIGLKALDQAVAYQVNNINVNLAASTDMFYSLLVSDGETVTITNTSKGILSITDLKIIGTATLSAPEPASVARMMASVMSLSLDEPVEPTVPTTETPAEESTEATTEDPTEAPAPSETETEEVTTVPETEESTEESTEETTEAEQPGNRPGSILDKVFDAISNFFKGWFGRR